MAELGDRDMGGELERGLARFGAVTAPDGWDVPLMAEIRRISRGGGRGKATPRAVGRVWLTRNEGERRLSVLLLVGAYVHFLVSVFLFHWLSQRFPGHGLPVWIRVQPGTCFLMGAVLAAGGVRCFGFAADVWSTGHFYLALYMELLLLNAGIVLLKSDVPPAFFLILWGCLSAVSFLGVRLRKGSFFRSNRRKAFPS